MKIIVGCSPTYSFFDQAVFGDKLLGFVFTVGWAPAESLVTLEQDWLKVIGTVYYL